jgi:hypothetical protein
MMVQATGRTDLVEFAKNVREKLQSAIDAVWTESVHPAELIILKTKKLLELNMILL